MASHELADLLARKLGANTASTALLIERGLRRYLLRRGGQLDFVHGQLRQAVMERYGEPASRKDAEAWLEVRFVVPVPEGGFYPVWCDGQAAPRASRVPGGAPSRNRRAAGYPAVQGHEASLVSLGEGQQMTDGHLLRPLDVGRQIRRPQIVRNT